MEIVDTEKNLGGEDGRIPGKPHPGYPRVRKPIPRTPKDWLLQREDLEETVTMLLFAEYFIGSKGLFEEYEEEKGRIVFDE